MDHLAFHKVDIPEFIKTLAHYGPTLIGVCIVAYNFTREHVTSEEESVAESTAGGGISSF